MAPGRGKARGKPQSSGRGGGRGGRGGQRPSRGERDERPAFLSSVYNAAPGRPSHAPPPLSTSPGSAAYVTPSRGRGGRGGGSGHMSSHVSRGGGRSPHLQGPLASGMANQFVFVEQEEHGIWRVSVPRGQRFSKQFLAGLEVWAIQMTAGGATLTRSAAAPAALEDLPATSPFGVPTPPPPVTPLSGVRPPPPPPPGPSPLMQRSASATGTPGQPGGTTTAGLPGQHSGTAAVPPVSHMGISLPSLSALGLPSLDAPSPPPPPPRRSATATPATSRPPDQTPPGTSVATAGVVSAGVASPAAAVSGTYDMASFLKATVLGVPPPAEASPAAAGAGTGTPQPSTSGNFYSVELERNAPDVEEPAVRAFGSPSAAVDHVVEAGRSAEAKVDPAAEASEGVLAPGSSGSTAQDAATASADHATAGADAGAGAPTDDDGDQDDDANESFSEGDSSGSGSWATESCTGDSSHGDADEAEGQGGEDGVSDDDEDEEDDVGDDDGEDGSSGEDDGGAEEEESDGSDGSFDSRDFDEWRQQQGTSSDEECSSDESSSSAFDVDAPEALEGEAAEEEEGASRRQRPWRGAAAVPRAGRYSSRQDRTLVSSRQHGSSLPHSAAASPGLTPGAAQGRASTQVVAHDAQAGRLRVSVRLERQALTDVETALFAQWYEERVSSKLELAKLWLFDNSIGDEGAAALAPLLRHGTLLEVHLSHNFITIAGATALLAAVPTQRHQGSRPLWLRLEWNVLDAEQMMALCQRQRQSRGLIVEVPQAVKASQGHEHELHLQLRPNGAAHVRLPWVASQKQPPAEAAILKQVKGIYRSEAASAATVLPPPSAVSPSARGCRPPPPAAAAGVRAASAFPPPPVVPPIASQPVVGSCLSTTGPLAAVAPPAQSLPIGVPPSQQQPGDMAGPSSSADFSAPAVSAAVSPPGGGGPLLLFPDTSALLLMIAAQQLPPSPAGGGGGTPAGGAPLALGGLQRLALAGRFGRDLPLHDQTFVVLADSVMKQLDGLKHQPDVRVAVRKFLGEGLESMGPAGTNILTVLGGHEGEGLVVEAGAGGCAGSNSRHVASKGQAVDIKIVEVALFFMKEVLKAQQQGSADGGSSPSSAGALPVILLSNDNAQIVAAKAHGLPAFRLAGAHDLAAQIQQVTARGGSLTSDVLRGLLSPAATLGLGSTAGRSLQEQFDGVVATLRALLVSYGDAVNTLQTIEQAAADAPSASSGGGVEQAAGSAAAAEGGEAEVSAAAASAPLDTIRSLLQPGVVPALQLVAHSIEPQLREWEACVRSHQDPSRVLKWASGTS